MSEIKTNNAIYDELLVNAADTNFEIEFKGDKSRQFWLLSIVTDSTFNGTTATATLYISVDGTNYIIATDADGISIVNTLESNSIIIINNEKLYPCGAFKLAYDKGNASAGTVTVRLNDGK